MPVNTTDERDIWLIIFVYLDMNVSEISEDITSPKVDSCNRLWNRSKANLKLFLFPLTRPCFAGWSETYFLTKNLKLDTH